MTADSSGIDIGVMDLREPTLLLLGDALAFRALARELGTLHAIVLGGQRTGGGRALLHILPVEFGSEFSGEGREYSWRISSSEAKKVAQQLSALADSPQPAHAYLDPADNAAATQIIASIGEYDSERVF